MRRVRPKPRERGSQSPALSDLLEPVYVQSPAPGRRRQRSQMRA